MIAVAAPVRSRLRPGPLLWGGLAIGTLDLLFAWAFWFRHGVGPGDILQAVAAGWYGPRSRSLGATSMVVGALSHYFIALAFVAAYAFAARQLPALRRSVARWGALYGVVLYLAMNFVVLPLSAAGLPSFRNVGWVVASVVAHVVFGVMAARFGRRALA